MQVHAVQKIKRTEGKQDFAVLLRGHNGNRRRQAVGVNRKQLLQRHQGENTT